MRKFYDPEYDRIVTEDVPKKQYEYFKKQPWFTKTYEQFLAENFIPEEEDCRPYCIPEIVCW